MVQGWVSIIVTATDPHAAVRAVMALILTRRCGPSWTRRQAYGRWQILTAVAERGSCRLPQNS